VGCEGIAKRLYDSLRVFSEALEATWRAVVFGAVDAGSRGIEAGVPSMGTVPYRTPDPIFVVTGPTDFKILGLKGAAAAEVTAAA